MIRKRILALMAITSLTVATLAGNPIRVACIGNSITYGHGIQDRQHDTYPAQLQALLGSDFDVQNFGVSGTTAQREGDFPWTSTPQYRQALDFQPQIAVFKLGTNDSKPQNWVGTDRFIRNVEELVSEFERLSSHPRIVIALPAKAYKVAWNIRDSVICHGQLKALKKLAKRHHWRVVDTYTLTSNHLELFPDGIHPTPQGAAIIAAGAQKAILKESKKVKKSTK